MLNIYIRTLPCGTGFSVHQDRETKSVAVVGKLGLVREVIDRLDTFCEVVGQNQEAAESIISQEEIACLFDKSKQPNWFTRKMNEFLARDMGL